MDDQLTAGGGNEGPNETGDEVYRRDLLPRLKHFVGELFKKLLADVAEFDTRPFPLARSFQMNVDLSEEEVIIRLIKTAEQFAVVSVVKGKFNELKFESLDDFRRFLDHVAIDRWEIPHGTRAVFDENHPLIFHLSKNSDMSEVYTHASYCLKLRQT